MNKFISIMKDIKAKISKNGSKKIIEKAVIIAIVGAICLIAGSVLFEDNQNKTQINQLDQNSALAVQQSKTQSDAVEAMKQTKDETKSEMEENLRSILSKIKGAGKVDVMITFVSGNESVPVYDVNTTQSSTQEKDKEGGARDIKESSKDNKIVYEESQGTKKPFVVKELLPKVKGVVIVADGAGNAEVKNNLSMAAQALLEVADYKIQVFQRSDN